MDAFFYFVFYWMAYFSFLREWLPALKEAAWLTFYIAFIGNVIGLFIGFFLGKMRAWRIAPLNFLAFLYSQIVCGIPFIVWAFFIYYGVSYHYNMSPEDVGIAVIALVSSANFAELIAKDARRVRLEVKFINQGIDLDRLPLALGQQAIQSFRDTSILSIIGLPEITSAAHRMAMSTFKMEEMFIVLAVFYLSLSVLFSLILRFLQVGLPILPRKGTQPATGAYPVVQPREVSTKSRKVVNRS